MRVTEEGIYRNLTSYIQSNLEKVSNLNEEISSGKKILNISDSPVEYSQLIKYKKKLKHIEQYNKDITRADAWLKTTNSSIENINDITRQIKILTEQAATETYSSENRKEISYSIDSYAEELMQNINTDINGKYIFSGFKTDKKPFKLNITSSNSNYDVSDYKHSFDLNVKIKMISDTKYKFSLDGGNSWLDNNGNGYEINSVNPVLGFTITSSSANTGDEVDLSFEHVYQGDSGEFKIESNKDNHIQINIGGNEIYTHSTDTNVFKVVGELWAGLVTNNRDLISMQIPKLNNIEKNNLTLLAKTGSRINRFDMIKNSFLAKDKDITNKNISDIEDVDVTEAMTKLALQQTVFQATLKTTAMVSRLTILNFL